MDNTRPCCISCVFCWGRDVSSSIYNTWMHKTPKVGFSTVVATCFSQIQGFTPDYLSKTKKTTSVVHIHRTNANVPCESTSKSQDHHIRPKDHEVLKVISKNVRLHFSY